MKVLVTEPISARGLELLAREVEILQPASPTLPETMGLAGEVDGVIVRRLPVSRQLIDSAKRLKVIGRHGAGTDTVDLAYATERGIPVVYTPGANALSVAEYTVALMLALVRKTCHADRAVRSGESEMRTQLIGLELLRKCIGVVGLGLIGSQVAGICANGFQMRVLGYDPYVPVDQIPAGVERCTTLDELLQAADIVTLHVPLTEETRGLINATRLAQMKPFAYLINTARGQIVVEADLYRALEAGRLAGAALDVFSSEPLPADSPLLGLDNVLLSPHVGAQTVEAMDRMALEVVQDVLAVLRGERPRCVANPQAWDRLHTLGRVG